MRQSKLFVVTTHYLGASSGGSPGGRSSFWLGLKFQALDTAASRFAQGVLLASARIAGLLSDRLWENLLP
jgi:hypothetical protein